MAIRVATLRALARALPHQVHQQRSGSSTEGNIRKTNRPFLEHENCGRFPAITPGFMICDSAVESGRNSVSFRFVIHQYGGGCTCRIVIGSLSSSLHAVVCLETTGSTAGDRKAVRLPPP